MKRIFVLFIALVAYISIFADDSIVIPVRANIISEMSGVEVYQDSTVARLLHNAIYGEQELVEIDGYRVQIYSSNQQQIAKEEALELEKKLKEYLPHTIYVTYVSPFWKVRVGDFRTYEEAYAYKKEFVQMYPEQMGDTYIVKDKIKVLP
jgi:hypothetical protein